MRLISLIVLVVAAIVLASVFMNADGLFSGMFDGDFRYFSNRLFFITQAFALPIILGMLGLIGLTISRNRR